MAAQILGALRAGNYFETAVAYAGADASSVRKWVKKGIRNAKGCPPEYVTFARDVLQAQTNVEVRNVAVIANVAAGTKAIKVKGEKDIPAIPPDWHAAAWFLERKYPQHWGRRDFMKITVEQAAALSDDELDRELKKRGLA